MGMDGLMTGRERNAVRTWAMGDGRFGRPPDGHEVYRREAEFPVGALLGRQTRPEPFQANLVPVSGDRGDPE
jgi:hypothetical protein